MSNNQSYRQYGNFYPSTTAAYPYYPTYPMNGYAAPAQAVFPSQQLAQVQQVQQPPQATQQQQSAEIPGMLPLQQSYIENILRLNRGKLVRVYMTFEQNSDWNAKIFTGIIEAAGRDHLILSQPGTGKRVLLLMVYLDYVEFEEEINYEYPYADGSQLSTYAPRK